MIDPEKVIKGLGIHADRSDKTDCDDCPYSKDDFSKGNCIGQLCSDALALLKEQENMIPITVIAEYLARYAAPPVRSPLAVYGDLVTAWERFLKDLNRR